VFLADRQTDRWIDMAKLIEAYKQGKSNCLGDFFLLYGKLWNLDGSCRKISVD
jgi:hypothetical protein